MKVVVYSRRAQRALRRHANRATLIAAKIEQYATDPSAQASNVKQLVSKDGA